MRWNQKALRSLLLLLSTAVVVDQGFAAATEDRKATIVKYVDNVLESAGRDEGYPGVSVAVYLRGEPYHLATSGFADLKTKQPPDQDTIFRMYSVTKGITQILAAISVDAGELDIGAPISKYTSGLPGHMQGITTRQLLLHRAGVRHYESDREWLQLSDDYCENPEDAFNQFMSDPLIFSPGTGTSYSSFGYVLLSEVLETSAGISFRELVEQRIWSPSRVRRIGFDSQTEEFSNVTGFYEPIENRYERAPSVDNSCKFGGGAIVAAPKGVAKIFSDFYTGRFTSRTTLERFVPAISQPCNAISMGGEGMGGRSAVAYPSDNLVVVLAANSRGGELIGYGHQIADLVSKMEPESTAACHRN